MKIIINIMPVKSYDVKKTVNIKHKKGFLATRAFWVYRYRIYTLISIFVLIFIMYSSSINIPTNIQAYGYKTISENFLYTKLDRNKIEGGLNYVAPTYLIDPNSITSNPVALNFEFTALDLKEKLKQINVDSGLINIDTMRALGIKVPIPEREEVIPFDRYKTEVEKFGTPLQELSPAPENALNTNFIRIEDYNINAPIIYASFEDMFDSLEDGSINFGSPKDVSDTSSPLQQRLRDGVVHIPFTPYPGEIGNSYIVGHSSNYSFVKSDYNQVFKPIEGRGDVGQVFTIFDPFGRELKFRIFEAVLIEEENYQEAYKNFDGKRVVTLQTSVVSWRPSEGWQPYQRWLVRGELLCGENVCDK